MENLIQQLNQISQDLRKELGREPTIQEIAKKAQVPEKEVKEILRLPSNEENPATIQFFAIYEKEKEIRILPCFLNKRWMNSVEMSELPIAVALSGQIVIPNEPLPWSKISRDADHIFLAIQSRRDWGSPIDLKTNLLKVEAIRKVVEDMEDSLNNFSFRRDYMSGKFNVPENQTPLIIKPQSEKPQESPEGVSPGQNWPM